MEKIATENLFLLEFLVDNVTMNPKCDCSDGEGERCVSFQFLDNAPLDVCEEDFGSSPTAKTPANEKDSVKSGKSCLFSLSPDQAKAALQNFDIYVSIFKKMPAGWLPERIEVGEALISIANLFSELISSVESSDGTTPTAKTLKDTFNINHSNEVIGKIGVYIRMSCFGKLIVTQFQMNLEDKSVLFKDKEGKSLYRYKKAGKGRKGKPDTCTPRMPGMGERGASDRDSRCPISPCAPPGNAMNVMNSMGGSGCPVTPCVFDQQNYDPYGRSPPCPPTASCVQMQGNSAGRGMGMPGGPNMAPFGEFSPYMSAPGGMGMMGAMTPCRECGNIPNASCLPPQNMTPCIECGALTNAPCMSFQGGMNMGGPMTPCMECGNIPNAPCLPQMPYSSPNALDVPCEECSGLPNPPCATQPEVEGNYEEIGATMGGNSLTIRVHKDKNKVEQVDPNEAYSEAMCCCSPCQIGDKKRKKERSFQMKPGVQRGKEEVPFSFKMGKMGQNPGKNNVVVNPPISISPDGTKFTEFSDPNKELFILRVGKKTEGVGKKQNLELELCTPRGKAK